MVLAGRKRRAISQQQRELLRRTRRLHARSRDFAQGSVLVGHKPEPAAQVAPKVGPRPAASLRETRIRPFFLTFTLVSGWSSSARKYRTIKASGASSLAPISPSHPHPTFRSVSSIGAGMNACSVRYGQTTSPPHWHRPPSNSSPGSQG